MTTFGIRIGEAYTGDGAEAAHVNVVIGDMSVLGPSFAQAIANQGPGHAPFVTVLRPSLPVRPLTLFVNKATIADERHGNLTWGAAQAGVAVGMTDAVATGRAPSQRGTQGPPRLPQPLLRRPPVPRGGPHDPLALRRAATSMSPWGWWQPATGLGGQAGNRGLAG